MARRLALSGQQPRSGDEKAPAGDGHI
jgi:hypothetical protein